MKDGLSTDERLVKPLLRLRPQGVCDAGKKDDDLVPGIGALADQG
jgi:hypothetical protein